MADKSKIRMNLAAIKRVDPYAKNIIDSSSHVAFYTFNSELNEWEKTDVEGAFFIYSRNAQPFHSIFINNRLNTTTFVEPITCRLELQSQPPFLLYRNERSRIRGFWFYNSRECDRIGGLVNDIIKSIVTEPTENTQVKQPNVNIFNMLSKAQQEYNSKINENAQQNVASNKVLQFFASAKPAASEVPLFNRMIFNSLSVEQLEKQHCERNTLDGTPKKPIAVAYAQSEADNSVTDKTDLEEIEAAASESVKTSFSPNLNATGSFNSLSEPSKSENFFCQILSQEQNTKPALMPPTMFDKPAGNVDSIQQERQPLNQAQFVQAFTYLIQNDPEFVYKLHEAYLKTVHA